MRFTGIVVFLFVLSGTAVPTLAQNSNDINAGIQFDFSQPGARSEGMGGAFVAVADDATAVYGNPAGLMVFTRPEVSAEIRYWRWRSRVASGGHGFGPPSGRGTDTIAGVVRQRFTEDDTDPAFLSAVYPFGKWTVGVFTRALSRYKMERQPTGTFFDCAGGIRPAVPFCEPRAAEDGIDRLNPAAQAIDLDISSFGATVATTIAPRVNVGFALQYSTFEMDASNQVFSLDDSDKFAPPNFSASNIGLTSVQHGEDSAISIIGGVLWQITDRLAMGGAFQQGPRFQFATRTELATGLVVADVPDNPFKVPDQYSAGIAFRPNPNASSGQWLLSAEWNRVQFSQLMDDFQEIGTPAGSFEGATTVARLTIDNADRVRAGGEYLLRLPMRAERLWTIALRAGAVYDPQHQIYFRAGDDRTGAPSPRAALYFMKGDDEYSTSAGIGLVLGRVQLDAAATFGGNTDVIALSTVFGF
jgi:long-subunit fatty acid transport protein